MKRVIKQEPQYVAQMVEIETFVTVDGREFETEEQALTHERILSVLKKRFEPRHYITTDGDWLLFPNKEEMEWYTSAACNHDELPVDLQYPAWILLRRVSSHNYHEDDTLYVYSKEQVVETLNGALRFVESLGGDTGALGM